MANKQIATCIFISIKFLTNMRLDSCNRAFQGSLFRSWGTKHCFLNTTYLLHCCYLYSVQEQAYSLLFWGKSQVSVALLLEDYSKTWKKIKIHKPLLKNSIFFFNESPSKLKLAVLYSFKKNVVLHDSRRNTLLCQYCQWCGSFVGFCCCWGLLFKCRACLISHYYCDIFMHVTIMILKHKYMFLNFQITFKYRKLGMTMLVWWNLIAILLLHRDL